MKTPIPTGVRVEVDGFNGLFGYVVGHGFIDAADPIRLCYLVELDEPARGFIESGPFIRVLCVTDGNLTVKGES